MSYDLSIYIYIYYHMLKKNRYIHQRQVAHRTTKPTSLGQDTPSMRTFFHHHCEVAVLAEGWRQLLSHQVLRHGPQAGRLAGDLSKMCCQDLLGMGLLWLWGRLKFEASLWDEDDWNCSKGVIQTVEQFKFISSISQKSSSIRPWYPVPTLKRWSPRPFQIWGSRLSQNSHSAISAWWCLQGHGRESHASIGTGPSVDPQWLCLYHHARDELVCLPLLPPLLPCSKLTMSIILYRVDHLEGFKEMPSKDS